MGPEHIFQDWGFTEIEIEMKAAPNFQCLFKRREDSPAGLRSLPLHIHLLHLIQRTAGAIRQAHKLPPTTATALVTGSQLLDGDIPPFCWPPSAIFVAFNLSCHLEKEKDGLQHFSQFKIREY